MDELEDRIAAYIMAVLYTHYHLDLPVHGVPADTKPSKMGAVTSGLLAATKEASTNYVAQIQNTFGNMDIGATHHALATKDMDGDRVKADNSYRASEVYENCVAVTISGNVLYMAINFKVRRNPMGANTLKDFRTFAYSGFGDISELAMDNIAIALSRELVGVSSPAQGRVQKLCFITPIIMPADESQAAAFHAEMQLVSYLEMEAGQTLWGGYIGVNKPCCPNCAGLLQKRHIRFAARHEAKVTNWMTANSMRTMVRSEKQL